MREKSKRDSKNVLTNPCQRFTILKNRFILVLNKKLEKLFQRVEKKLFRHAGRLLKKFRKTSNSRLSAYIGTIGRELRRKSKSLRSKQYFSKIVPYMSF